MVTDWDEKISQTAKPEFGSRSARNPLSRSVAVFLVLLAVIAKLGTAQQPRRDSTSLFFYTGQTFGSAATVTPATIVLNRGFSIIQLGARYPRDPRQIDWHAATNRVINALAHPVAAVERYGGWMKFLQSELIPFAGVPVEQASWFPNYTGHILAGGQSYRYMSEWFAAHGTPYPRASAALLYMSTQFVNEIIEHHPGTGGSAATAADLLVFDPASIAIFEIDAVARFFSTKVRSLDWSPMPSITLPNGEVQNNGQEMAYKLPLPFVRGRADALIVLGLAGRFGSSIHAGGGNNVSATFGIAAIDRAVDPVTQQEEVDLALSYGAFWDRDDSLLASVVVGSRGKNELAVNVYPGVLPGIARNLGVWLVRTQEHGIRFGFSSGQSLGLGLGYGQ